MFVHIFAKVIGRNYINITGERERGSSRGVPLAGNSFPGELSCVPILYYLENLPVSVLTVVLLPVRKVSWRPDPGSLTGRSLHVFTEKKKRPGELLIINLNISDFPLKLGKFTYVKCFVF